MTSTSTTAFATLALTLIAHKVYTSSKKGFYLSKKQVKATGLTVVTIGKDAKNYVVKTYKNSYKKIK